MPLGQLYDRYVAQSSKLRDQAQEINLANRESAQRPWMVPDLGDGDWTIPGLVGAYDRGQIAAAYAEIHQSPEGTVGDAMSAKLQSDCLAGQERAYRLRQSSAVRACMHAAGRRAGHGNPSVGLFARVDGRVQDLIVAGAAGYHDDESDRVANEPTVASANEVFEQELA